MPLSSGKFAALREYPENATEMEINRMRVFTAFFLVTLSLVFWLSPSTAAKNEECFECHSEEDLTKDRGVETISLFVDEEAFQRSVHRDFECIECHEDAELEDYEHPTELARIECGSCHEQEGLDFESGIHGTALKRGAFHAPDCQECHGVHDILASFCP